MATSAGKYKYISATVLVPSDNASYGTPLDCRGKLFEVPHVTTLDYAELPGAGNIPASALVNGFLVLRSQAHQIFHLPPAAQIFAAFAAAGTPFRVGDTFTVKVTNIMPVPVNLGQVTHMGISSDGVAGLTPLNGDTMALQCGCTAELLFTVASLDNAIMWGILSGKFTTNLLLL